MTRALAAAFAALLVGCAGVRAAESSHDAFGALLGSGATRSTGTARPPVTTVVREGDARGAVAVAVSTEGIDADRGALVGVALAALVQQRMANAGVEVTAVGGWNGWSLRALADSTARAQSLVAALRTALLTPVTSPGPELDAVQRHRPGTRLQHPADGEDQRGLARAVRAEEGGDFPGGDRDGHVLDDRPAAALDGDVTEFQYGHRSGHLSSRSLHTCAVPR